MIKRFPKTKGFTLIELLVVIAIIGLLASIVLVSLSGAKKRAQDARIISDMGQLRSSAEIYQSTNGSYSNFCNSGDATTLKTDILAQLPSTKQGTYNCQVASNGSSYCVEVQLNSDSWWCVDSNLRSQQYTNNPSCDTSQNSKSCQ